MDGADLTESLAHRL